MWRVDVAGREKQRGLLVRPAKVKLKLPQRCYQKNNTWSTPSTALTNQNTGRERTHLRLSKVQQHIFNLYVNRISNKWQLRQFDWKMIYLCGSEKHPNRHESRFVNSRPVGWFHPIQLRMQSTQTPENRIKMAYFITVTCDISFRTQDLI